MNILKFNEYQEYESYIQDEPILPNVSYCVDTNKVYYSPYELEPEFITARYDRGSRVNIINYDAFTHLTKMWVDGVEIDINSDSRIMIPIEQSEYSHVAFDFGDDGDYEIKFAFDRYYLIRDNSFSGCDLYEIYIPDFVTDIGSHAFQECYSLNSIILSEGVVNIGASAFFENLALLYINIPASVESIGDNAFQACIELKEVYMFGDVPPEIGEDVFSQCDSNLKIIVREGLVEEYANSWPQYSDIIQVFQTIDYNPGPNTGVTPINPNPHEGIPFNP